MDAEKAILVLFIYVYYLLYLYIIVFYPQVHFQKEKPMGLGMQLNKKAKNAQERVSLCGCLLCDGLSLIQAFQEVKPGYLLGVIEFNRNYRRCRELPG